MNELLEIYDIELTDSLNLEALYSNNSGDKHKTMLLEEINTLKRTYFKREDIYYNSKNIDCGYKCSLRLPLKESKYILKDDRNNILNWYNNQNKKIEFNNNLYKIYNNKYEIEFEDNGLIIRKKKFLGKFKYNLRKLYNGLKQDHKLYIYRLLKRKSQYILINDRVKEANDNGEALFRYICKNDKKLAKNTYYVISKGSNKYNELKKIGKVLKFGSIKHKIKFINTKVLATSYIGNGANVYNPFNDKEMNCYRDLINKKVIFLQHGILMSDFHSMFNRARMVIDKFVVSTKDEYIDILNQGYLYNDNNLIKTGLARYDLFEKKNENQILIFFTWRKWLAKTTFKEFKNSTYFINIKSLLTDKNFIKLVKKNNYKVKLVLHSELTNYFEIFKKLENTNIKIYKSNEIVYSQEFSKSSLLITDYSSIHYDMAYLNKPVIYYQFDYEDFTTKHTANGIGKFSYKNDGYGNVVNSKNKVINKLDYYLLNNFKVENKYKKRIEETFFYLDSNNSKRITEIIYLLLDDESKNYRFNNVQ